MKRFANRANGKTVNATKFSLKFGDKSKACLPLAKHKPNDNARKSIRIQVLILVFTLVFLRANKMVKVVLMKETLVKTRLKVLSFPWNSGI